MSLNTLPFVTAVEHMGRHHMRGCKWNGGPLLQSSRLAPYVACCVLNAGLADSQPLTSANAVILHNVHALTTQVTAPLIGKVAEVSTFRTAGTIIGGFLGYVVWQIGEVIAGGWFAGILVVAVSAMQ